MKLNKTYPLTEVLDALSAASAKLHDVVAVMRDNGELSRAYTVYGAEGMLTSSQFARVTLTRKVNEYRWEGYMETSAVKDGPRVPVAVVRSDMVVFSEDRSYSKLQVQTQRSGASWADVFGKGVK